MLPPSSGSSSPELRNIQADLNLYTNTKPYTFSRSALYKYVLQFCVLIQTALLAMLTALFVVSLSPTRQLSVQYLDTDHFTSFQILSTNPDHLPLHSLPNMQQRTQ
jgi:hypothetical protein